MYCYILCYSPLSSVGLHDDVLSIDLVLQSELRPQILVLLVAC